LHKQRKVARAVTARKLLISSLLLLSPKQEQERLAALAPSSALRAPSPASGRRVEAAPGAQAGVPSLRQVSLHKQRKVARAVTARKLLILMSEESKQQAGQDPPYEAGCRCRGS